MRKSRITFGINDMMTYQAVFMVGKAKIKVTFTDGSATAAGRRPATFTTENLMLQRVIMESPEFKKGMIFVYRKMLLNEEVDLERNPEGGECVCPDHEGECHKGHKHRPHKRKHDHMEGEVEIPQETEIKRPEAPKIPRIQEEPADDFEEDDFFEDAEDADEEDILKDEDDRPDETDKETDEEGDDFFAGEDEEETDTILSSDDLEDETLEDEDFEEPEEKRFTVNDEAKDYLEETYGISRSSLKTRADIIKAGEENGVKIIFTK